MVRSLLRAALLVMGLAPWLQLSCAAQTSAEGPDSLYKLEGSVVNAETGRPIPRALVQLFTMNNQAVLTDAEGAFSFGKLSRGLVMVKVEKPGFFDPTGRPQGFPLRKIEVGPENGKVILKLEPECSIAGEVLSDEGEPIEGATVEAFTTQIINGRSQLMQVPSNVTTDEDGLFRIAGLSSGKYFVNVRAGVASRRILGAQSKGRAQTYPLIAYFPGVTDIAAATPINLVPGQHAHAEFTVSLAPAFKISGMVSGISGFKQVSAPMIIDGERPLLVADHWNGQTGAFEFTPLAAGTYTIRVYAMIDDKHPTWTKQSITLNHDVNGLNVALQLGATIPVSVQTEFNGPPPQGGCFGGAAIDRGKTTDCPKFMAMVTLASEMGSMQVQTEPEITDPSALVIHGVMPGKYRVQVSPVVQGYVRSVRSGATDLLREELVVPAGGSVPPIEIVLRDDGAKVKVHVQAEHMPENVQVLLLPDFAPNQSPVEMGVSPEGDGEYADLAPGDYKVLAFESLDSIEYENPDALQKYAAKAAHITLSAQGTTNVTVELIREGE